MVGRVDACNVGGGGGSGGRHGKPDVGDVAWRGVAWRDGAAGVYMQRVPPEVHNVMLTLVKLVKVTSM